MTTFFPTLWQDHKYKLIAGGVSISIITLFAIHRYSQKQANTSYTIKDVRNCPRLKTQTLHLLQSQWPDISSKSYPSLNSTTTSKQPNDEWQAQADAIPCHRILIKTSPKSIFNLHTLEETVIGHVYLKDSFRVMDIEKIQKWLKVGIPVSGIKQRAKMAGIDLDDERFHDENGQFTLQHVKDMQDVGGLREIYIGSLVVDPSHRMNGFAKLLLSDALIYAHGLGYTKLFGTASRNLVGFYKRLGGNKEEEKMYRMNGISLSITEEMLKTCWNTLSGTKHKLNL